MIDIESRKIIDMIESRESEKVSEWLKGYANLEIISRDRSLSYKAAIEKADKEIVQISDRFHIFKNFTDYCKEHILRTIKPKIKIEKDKTELNKEKIKKLEFKAAFEKEEQSELEKLKSEIISEVKELKKRGYSIRAIMKITGLSRNTVRKYLRMKFSWKHGSKGVKRGSKVDKYIPYIKELIQKGYNKKQIYEKIKKIGYTGSYSLLKYRIKNPKSKIETTYLQNYIEEKTVSRSKIIKLLYKPLNKIKGITEDDLKKVIQKHSFLEEIYNSLKEFKEIFEIKSIEKLHGWIEKYENSLITGIQSFITGLKEILQQ